MSGEMRDAPIQRFPRESAYERVEQAWNAMPPNVTVKDIKRAWIQSIEVAEAELNERLRILVDGQIAAIRQQLLTAMELEYVPQARS